MFDENKWNYCIHEFCEMMRLGKLQLLFDFSRLQTYPRRCLFANWFILAAKFEIP